ncbi:antitoxin family protein [Paludisphaera sp.]|uniref:antitoxin family protein n=1 Tax=Paludisphaera sp. TaxID=2017432 RepID=UPI00301C5190
MKTIAAVHGNGVFRPIEPVDLLEGCEVKVDPKVEGLRQLRPTEPEFAHLDPGLARSHAILSHR